MEKQCPSLYFVTFLKIFSDLQYFLLLFEVFSYIIFILPIAEFRICIYSADSLIILLIQRGKNSFKIEPHSGGLNGRTKSATKSVTILMPSISLVHRNSFQVNVENARIFIGDSIGGDVGGRRGLCDREIAI